MKRQDGINENQPSRDSIHTAKQALIDNRKERSLAFTFISSIRNMPKNNEEPQPSTLTEVPEGFAVRVGPGGKKYLVPQYMIPALDQAFAAYHHKGELNVLSAQPEVRQINHIGSAPFLFFYRHGVAPSVP